MLCVLEITLHGDKPLTRGSRLALRDAGGWRAVHLVDVVELVGQVGNTGRRFPVLRSRFPGDARVQQRAPGHQAQLLVLDVREELSLVVGVNARCDTACRT